jgi:hypothetical protein
MARRSLKLPRFPCYKRGIELQKNLRRHPRLKDWCQNHKALSWVFIPATTRKHVR